MSLRNEIEKILKEFEQLSTDAYTQGDKINYDELDEVYRDTTNQILSLLEGSLPKEKVNNKGIHDVWNAEDYAVEWRTGWNAAIQEIKNNLRGEK